MRLSRRQALRALGVTAGAGLAGTWMAGRAAAQSGAPEVPAPFRALYDTLAAQLTRIESALDAALGVGVSPPPLIVELLTANSNRGEQLLRPETLEATSLLLDRLQGMELQGVILSINFPLLTSSFPRFGEYVDFYRQVAEAVRGRGMRLAVETSTIFPDPEFSSLGVDYSGLTLAAYQRGKREQAEVILSELRPDYLTVETESTTVTRNTGLPYPPDAYLETVRYVLDGLDRGGARIGAGSGSWDDIGLFERLAAETDVDNVDVHFYPIQGDLLWDRAGRIAEIARAAGKGLTVGESWLYKVAPNEQTGQAATAVNVFGRDVYSFWAPLDQRFVRIMARLASGLAMEFCSLYWISYLFSYLEYTDELARAPYAQRQARLNALATANIVSGRLSPTGETLQDLLK